jgi:hypothetical protein
MRRHPPPIQGDECPRVTGGFVMSRGKPLGVVMR